MTKEQEPIKIDIPVEDEQEATKEVVDIPGELRKLGKQFADTLEAAWSSQERQRVEGEIREGMSNFAEELGKLFSEVKESSAAQRVRSEAETVKTKVNEAEMGKKAKGGLAKGLGWLSEELGKLAEKFTPAEKSPEDIE